MAFKVNELNNKKTPLPDGTHETQKTSKINSLCKLF